MEKFGQSVPVLEKGLDDPLVKAEEKWLEEAVKKTGQELENIRNLLPVPEVLMAVEDRKIVSKPPTITLHYWFQEMQKKIGELDVQTQKLMSKGSAGESLSEAELDFLNESKNKFWQENYGMTFSDWQKQQRQMEKTKPKPAAKLKSPKEPEVVSMSEQERLDATMDTSQSGWQRYWLRRLLPEGALLPDSIKEIVLKYRGSASGFSGDDAGILANYVHKRITAKRFELQKREEMIKLKNNLREIDIRQDFSPEVAKNRRTVFFNIETQNLFVEDEEGSKKEITFGDLIGDYSWGIKYRLDASVPPKLWRKMRKTLALYETRHKIGDIFNEELNRDYHTGFPTTAIDINFIDSRVDNPRHQSLVSGTIAERMITEFLTRAQYNNPELNLRIEESNALEDAVLKYDFKIRLKQRRGIALEAEDAPREEFTENKRKIGVQFTISKDPSITAKKLDQIKSAKERLKDYEDLMKVKIDDIVLVSLPALKNFFKLYQRWVADGRPSGGPEQYLSREEKLAIFKQATTGLLDLSDKQLEQLKI